MFYWLKKWLDKVLGKQKDWMRSIPSLCSTIGWDVSHCSIWETVAAIISSCPGMLFLLGISFNPMITTVVCWPSVEKIILLHFLEHSNSSRYINILSQSQKQSYFFCQNWEIWNLGGNKSGEARSIYLLLLPGRLNLHNENENTEKKRTKRLRNAEQDREKWPDGIILDFWIEPCLKLNLSVNLISWVNISPLCSCIFELCFSSLQLKIVLINQLLAPGRGKPERGPLYASVLENTHCNTY